VIAESRRRHAVAALGVLVVHVLVLAALLEERHRPVRPDVVTIVSLSDLPRQEVPPDSPVRPALAPIRTHLVFDLPTLPVLPEVTEPSMTPSIAPISPLPAIAPSRPSGPVSLADELSVFCPARTAPAYPPQSRRLREQGEVRLRVELDETGRVSAVGIIRTSGYTRLDEAARAAVLTWRCQPATRDGQPVRAVAIQSLAFVLQSR
jgi:protein TonB